MAAYPATIKTFSAKANVTSVVDASHPTDSEAEIRAIELELGTNPRISTARAATYADVKARLESLETDYRLLTNHDSHGALTGLTGDDHAQYLRTDGTRVPTGSASHTGLPVAVQAGDTQSQGSLHTLARSDHRRSHESVMFARDESGTYFDVRSPTTSRSAFSAWCWPWCVWGGLCACSTWCASPSSSCC